MIVLFVSFILSQNSQPSRPQKDAVCTACGLLKPVTDYYSKGTRRDSACKECQKARKRQRREQAKASGNPSPPPAAVSQRNTQPHYPNIEPESVLQPPSVQVSFLHWEKRYGRPLKEVEKMEIRDNLSSFFKILTSESMK